MSLYIQNKFVLNFLHTIQTVCNNGKLYDSAETITEPAWQLSSIILFGHLIVIAMNMPIIQTTFMSYTSFISTLIYATKFNHFSLHAHNYGYLRIIIFDSFQKTINDRYYFYSIARHSQLRNCSLAKRYIHISLIQKFFHRSRL